MTSACLLVNKQFEFVEFVFNSVYVDLKYNEIYLHQTDTAWLVRHSRGECANCNHLSRISGGPATHFLGGIQPCVRAAWLAERLLLAGDIESNPGPKPTR